VPVSRSAAARQRRRASWAFGQRGMSVGMLILLSGWEWPLFAVAISDVRLWMYSILTRRKMVNQSAPDNALPLLYPWFPGAQALFSLPKLRGRIRTLPPERRINPPVCLAAAHDDWAGLSVGGAQGRALNSVKQVPLDGFGFGVLLQPGGQV
jgi:hypothetical protein